MEEKVTLKEKLTAPFKKEFYTKSRMTRYGKNSVMGIQHLFAMMGATILVPMLCNLNISIGLISAGVGTIIFFFITKRKVPVFLGSSFAFIAAFSMQPLAATDGAGNFINAIGSHAWNVSMAQTAIAILLTGLVYVILAVIIKFIGVERIRKIFPPVVVGPVIMVIGLCLANTAITNMLPPSAEGVSPTGYEYAAYLVTAILTAGTIIGFSVFAKGFLKVIPILLGIVVGYISAACFRIIDFGLITNSAWIIFQPEEFTRSFGFYKVMFTGEVWNAGLGKAITAFVPIAIVTFMEHLGDINASSIVVGKDFIKDPGVHRTLMGDGVATMAAGLLGGPCNTTYGENTAVLALTRNYNPNLLVLSAVFAIILGVFSKFGAVIGSIPGPVIGGASLILYGMIAANGLKTMVEAKVDFSDSKNLIVCSLILVIGIGMKAAGVMLNIGVFSFSPLAVATIVGIVVNAVFMLAKGKQVSGVSGTFGGELEEGIPSPDSLPETELTPDKTDPGASNEMSFRDQDT